MKPEFVEQITSDIALELLNDLVELHNLLILDKNKQAFYLLGTLTESIAERVRGEKGWRVRKHD